MARRGMVVGAFFAVMCLAARAEPFCWHNGQWDDTRAPQGALLTDNFGWWGRSVYTGVTYSYEGDPTSPRDILMHDATACGRRLLAGDSAWGWHRTVGRTGGRPLVVVFDFKRPCAFNEVDLLSQRTTNACGTVQAGFDGTN